MAKGNQGGIDYNLMMPEVRLRSPDDMQPDEDEAIIKLAHLSSTTEIYYDLIEKLGLGEALERVRGYGKANPLRCH